MLGGYLVTPEALCHATIALCVRARVLTGLDETATSNVGPRDWQEESKVVTSGRVRPTANG